MEGIRIIFYVYTGVKKGHIKIENMSFYEGVGGFY